MYSKDKLSIYIAKNELLYVILKSKKAIYGAVPIASYDEKNREKEILAQITDLLKKYKARSVSYAMDQGNKITKVIQKDIGSKKTKPKNLEAMLSNEVKGILNQNESIKNFYVSYSRFDDTFLVAAYSKNIVENTCSAYANAKINLLNLTVPEEALFNLILCEHGVSALFFYDGASIKTVVSVDGKPLFVKKDEKNDETILSSILDDVSDVKDYVLMKTDRAIQDVYLAGDFPEDIDQIIPDAKIITLEHEIPSKYAVALGNLAVFPKNKNK